MIRPLGAQKADKGAYGWAPTQAGGWSDPETGNAANANRTGYEYDETGGGGQPHTQQPAVQIGGGNVNGGLHQSNPNNVPGAVWLPSYSAQDRTQPGYGGRGQGWNLGGSTWANRAATYAPGGDPLFGGGHPSGGHTSLPTSGALPPAGPPQAPQYMARGSEGWSSYAPGAYAPKG